jgi:hypothetical protein
MFCKRRSSEGPTEKDAILRDLHTAAISEEEEVLEKHYIQNQVGRTVDLTSTSKHNISTGPCHKSGGLVAGFRPLRPEFGPEKLALVIRFPLPILIPRTATHLLIAL